MKSINLIIATLLFLTACNAQIKNAKTETVKINGNCGMCESKIEEAGNLKKSAEVDWNKDTKTATITYDSTTTSKDEVLKRIALAGYDSEEFLAPDDVYAELPGCCQYNRENKKSEADSHSHHGMNNTDPANHSMNMSTQGNLNSVFDAYFSLKDALVKSDAKAASENSAKLVSTIKAVNMSELSADEHSVWMNVMKELTSVAEHLAKSKDIEHQRTGFATLSDKIYELMKVSEMEAPVYYQHCPMYNDGKGANWLSKESIIKNPYYGSQMLSCGKTIETLK